jgi:uncharacterized protein (DUF2235 family)
MSQSSHEAIGNSPDASNRPDRPIKKLVLCFDGTGNAFSGSTADTNIVKLFEKFDRDDPNQFHYYQSTSDFLRQVCSSLKYFSLLQRESAPTTSMDVP